MQQHKMRPSDHALLWTTHLPYPAESSGRLSRHLGVTSVGARRRLAERKSTRLPSLLSAVALFGVGYLMPSPLQLSISPCERPSTTESRKIEDARDAPNSTSATKSSFGDDVERVYLDFLDEAERRSESDFRASHTRGERGVAIGPVDGNFVETLKAMRNARRIRNVSPPGRGIRVALVTSRRHADVLEKCAEEPAASGPNEAREACRLWANGTLFDDVVFNREPPWVNESHATQSVGNGRYWMISMAGALLAPYKETLVLDSDAYPCPGFEKLFAVLKPYSGKYFALPSTADVDLATGIEQYPTGGGHWTQPGERGWHSDFRYFSERNTGTLLWNFHRRISHTFARFLILVAEHMYNHVTTPDNMIINDQTPWRVALYLFRKLRPEFNEQHFPLHSSCRTYPDKGYAGIDGARNGMYPVQGDGRICGECRCTPCLINHNHLTHFVNINGKKGWEDEEFIDSGGNSLPGNASSS